MTLHRQKDYHHHWQENPHAEWCESDLQSVSNLACSKFVSLLGLDVRGATLSIPEQVLRGGEACIGCSISTIKKAMAVEVDALSLSNPPR